MNDCENIISNFSMKKELTRQNIQTNEKKKIEILIVVKIVKKSTHSFKKKMRKIKSSVKK